MSLLSVKSLTASYGVSQALFGVDLDINPGEVVALMGRNGMGKSTTVKAICRMIAAGGTLEFAGQNLHALPSHKAARLGLGLVPEGRRCFRDLTVAENLLATSRPGDWDMGRVTQLFPRLGERQSQLSASLSGGEQQMLAIGRALMTNPRLLILDEATEGLAPIIRQEIWAAINRLKQDTDMAILVIDKTLAELEQVCDRAVVLERGKTVWSGAMAALTPEISERYVGV
ncbi:ABC transporter ATP-binding protein [Tritonibacter mobilis]|uniref:ABC transporter ATP-binding protein n=1 Tax=Tritonibacter mobilis F1926 TaxID=1265309 RepID=A0A1B0ZZ93_9RHOB|nr:ABC transporter ATP-binding protein [Tritonibacter mobilis]ANP39665.1 ABC transporter ATP-binding protein [Tritonibacter mobilis F1926]KJZ23854.1 ABC transporter ATP-binding protein [Tritonibacter mobilis]PXW81115.1 amino acid/amide ABC transporter ATP-binding protein 2 (HAAT family) [Ruegeria sp. P4]